jgi:unsaturated rhamnogalacturonyl hydrolase
MYCYAFAKGARLGVLDKSYREEAQRILKGLQAHKLIREEDGSLSLTDCCAVAGLGGNPYRDGTYEYYIHEKIRRDDPKGVAPLILACIELAR